MSVNRRIVDRSPIICAAGKVAEASGSVAECLKEYPIEDKIAAIKHENKIPEKTCFPYVPRRSVNTQNQGLYCESYNIFYHPITRRYETLIGALRDTNYQSFWDKPLGVARDPTAYLPIGMDPETTTFGMPTKPSEGVKELVNPPKSHLEVLLDSQEGHELYRKSHNDYNLNEQINRNYLKPAFDPNQRFGKQTITDSNGKGVQCAMMDRSAADVLVVVKDIQADVVNKKLAVLGKCLTPNNNIERVPKGFTFGKPSDYQASGVSELLKDPEVKPCLFRKQLMMWLNFINQLRMCLQRKRREGIINWNDFYERCRYFDKEKNNWLPAEEVYEICHCHKIMFDLDIMNALTTFFGILVDGQINYPNFINLIDISKEFPKLMKLNDIPEEHTYFSTTSRAADCDFLFIDNSRLPPAGIPTIRNDLDRPVVAPGNTRADLDNLGAETTAGAIINPSIFTNYGLSHRDFFLPRQPKYLKDLFEALNYRFPEDTFQKLWNMGVELDKTGLVCVDTFSKLLKAATPPPTFVKDDDHVC